MRLQLGRLTTCNRQRVAVIPGPIQVTDVYVDQAKRVGCIRYITEHSHIDSHGQIAQFR